MSILQKFRIDGALVPPLYPKYVAANEDSSELDPKHASTPAESSATGRPLLYLVLMLAYSVGTVSSMPPSVNTIPEKSRSPTTAEVRRVFISM